MKNANESVAEDRENYLEGIEQHFVNGLKIVGEGSMGIDLNSIRGDLFEELSRGLVCIKNLRELPEEETKSTPRPNDPTVDYDEKLTPLAILTGEMEDTGDKLEELHTKVRRAVMASIAHDKAECEERLKAANLLRDVLAQMGDGEAKRALEGACDVLGIKRGAEVATPIWPAAQPMKGPSSRTHIRRDDDILADAFDAIGEVLSALPDLNDGGEMAGHCLESAVKAYSCLHILRPLAAEKEQAAE